MSRASLLLLLCLLVAGCGDEPGPIPPEPQKSDESTESPEALYTKFVKAVEEKDAETLLSLFSEESARQLHEMTREDVKRLKKNPKEAEAVRARLKLTKSPLDMTIPDLTAAFLRDRLNDGKAMARIREDFGARFIDSKREEPFLILIVEAIDADTKPIWNKRFELVCVREQGTWKIDDDKSRMRKVGLLRSIDPSRAPGDKSPVRPTGGALPAVVYSPNGKILAVGSQLGEEKLEGAPNERLDHCAIRLINPETGARQLLRGHVDEVASLAYRADGKVLASRSVDGTLKVWSTDTNQVLRSVSANEGRLQFSPDGSLVGGCSFGNVVLRDAESLKVVANIKAHEQGPASIEFSPDGSMIATSGGIDGTVKIWDAKSHNRLRILAEHTRGVNDVAFSPNGKWLASAGDDHSVLIWEVATGARKAKLNGHADSVRVVAFSPDSSVVVSGSYDGTIRFWNVESGALRRISKWGGHTPDVLSFRPDGKVLASAGFGDIRIWTAK